MKKFRIKKIEFKQVDIRQVPDSMLLVNLYVTQATILIIGLFMIGLQKNNHFSSLIRYVNLQFIGWGIIFAIIVVLANLLISHFVPDKLMDDGGVNERMFAHRAIWHIAVISLVVAISEELLFRGAIQYVIGNYWTSIVFAAIHVRYLRHWLLTGLVFSTSYGLGWIYEQTDTLLTPIMAHFCIDFILGCMIRFRREK